MSCCRAASRSCQDLEYRQRARWVPSTSGMSPASLAAAALKASGAPSGPAPTKLWGLGWVGNDVGIFGVLCGLVPDN